MGEYQIGKDIAELRQPLKCLRDEIERNRAAQSLATSETDGRLRDLGVIVYDENADEYRLGPAFGKKKAK
jgi:hypothetical protein